MTFWAKKSFTAFTSFFFMITHAYSQTYPVTVNGQNYILTTITGSFPSLQSQLINTPWWGNRPLAIAFANSLGGLAGYPNTSINGGGPLFSYEDRGSGSNRSINYLPGGSTQQVSLGSANVVTYALGEIIPPPIPEPPPPPPGPNAVTTQQSLQTAENQTRVALQQRYAVMTTALDYDCAKFDKYGVCLSFEARGVGFDAMNTGAGVIKASYKLMDKVHAGVFLDYQAGGADPAVASITDGSARFGYDNATFGGFIGYNTLMGHTGFEARLTGAYNLGKISVQRAQLIANEAGMGVAGLNASGVYGQVGYGFPIMEGVVVTPFTGVRYTDVTRNAYNEQMNTLVLYPISYNAFSQVVVTGLGGGRINGKIIENLGYEIGGGVEGDFSRSLNAFSGYSYINLIGTFSYANNNAAWNGVRPFGLAGLTYDITPNQRITANTTVREQPFSTRSYMGGLVGYQVSF